MQAARYGRSYACRSLFQQSLSYAVSPEFYNVPEGHKTSDLSQLACNIGLMIRRDLTMREDIKLSKGSSQVQLKDILKGYKALVLGLPDAGSVCKSQHIPSYLEKFEDLKRQGITKIIAVSVGSPEKMEQFAKDAGIDSKKIEVWADAQGAFTRMLGLELKAPESAEGPWSFRYVALVNNGVLVKISVEDSPADCKKSLADVALDLASKY
eukprot:TRINITY_DN537_c0_g1_i2.p2 TRINITY_DN537_c0_g1~~TRINITY_DN537_c0_g1_i2.p2  ORF type:complete len:210 (+),score=27.90 TRINITY_DN537_c0_g1_i2:127-756(+)